jgi:hypothetical protein
VKLDRDNFRHLTGFGRDVAGYVDAVMGTLHDGRFVSGDVNTIYIYYDQDRNTLSHECLWYGSVSGQSPVDVALSTQLHIVAHRQDFKVVTSVPLFMLSPACRTAYHIYKHKFLLDQNQEDIEGAVYVGVTKRGWRTRWAEHVRAADAGSHYRFHAAIRQWQGVARCVTHSVIGHAFSEQMALEIEEDIVGRLSLYPLGLNMIPGGNAGLAYLRRIGALGKNERISIDDRQVVINRFFERTSRKGLPNPLAAANWLNADYAEKVICAGDDRLKPQQIRDARFLSSLGHAADEIAARVGARNVAQIQRLIAGETYSRII